MADVDQKDPFAQLEAEQDPFLHLEQPSVTEDIAKTTGPALLRGGVATVTGVPTLADLAAKGVSAGAPYVLSPEKAQTVQAGSEWLQKKLEPATYGSVMKDIQEGVPAVGFGGTGPLYEAKTFPGKVTQGALEIAPSLYTGATGIIPKVATPVSRMVRSLFGGLGSASAGELADKYLPEWAKPYAQAMGGITGVATGTAGARKMITPAPSTLEHAADVNILKQAGVKGLTAAQVTGSPRLAQIEANLAGEKLQAKDATSFTQAVAGKAGMPGVTALTSDALQRGEQGFSAYNKAVRLAEITPPNFSTMHTELANIRKEAFKDLRKDGIENIDNVINDLKGSPGALSMPGGRYQYMRQKIQGMLSDSSLTGTERKYLSEIRATLDAAMEKELPPSLAEQHKAYANFEILKNTKLDKNKQLTPEALHKAISGQWGEEAYNMGRGLSPIAAAGERVMGRPEAKTEPSRILQAGAATTGAGLARLLGQPAGESWVAAILGKEMAPALQGMGRFAARPAYFNPLVQALLKNQAMRPSPGTVVDVPTALRLLRGPIPGPIANQPQQ